MLEPMWTEPVWDIGPEVRSAISTRAGGVSYEKYATLNLSHQVDDDDGAVGENRLRLEASLPGLAKLAWLGQHHGTTMLAAHDVVANKNIPNPQADASWTDQPGIGCVVTTADCVPILLCAEDKSKVAAVHAGWRGLAREILKTATAQFDKGKFSAFIGPSISKANYMVGAEVLDQLAAVGATPEHFLPEGSGLFFADLPAIAKLQLEQLGAKTILTDNTCTYMKSQDYFSARRDGTKSGRFATVIWIVDPASEDI